MEKIKNKDKVIKLKKEKISKYSLMGKNSNNINLKHYFFAYFLFLSLFLLTKEIDKYKFHNPTPSLMSYIKYIKDCKKLIYYNRKRILNKNPYISVCIPALDMENFIERTILTILNQSFQDFEIIIINDFSKDETPNILNRLRIKDDRIKFISHKKNLGVYAARIEAIQMSKAKYIILMDPDDMFMNENLFQELYDYNLKYNLDIIEFIVYQQREGFNTIYFPNNHLESHYHNFSKKIIKQPELSNILFYNPGTTEYNKTICRNIWNKMIRKEPLIKMIEYIGHDYYNNFVITSDDMLMNIITYQYANNYSNIYLPGYMYNIRQVSMSRGNGGEKLTKIRAINHYLYFSTFYRYIKDFNKDLNFLFYELEDLQHYMRYIKDYKIVNYIPKAIKLFNKILNDQFASKRFKQFAKNMILYYKS